MAELPAFYGWLGRLVPMDCMQAGFMQVALAALLMLAPMAATLGVQVVAFRMAFFSDAISHSAFAGVAIGLLLAVDPSWTMPLFGVAVALAITALQRKSRLSADAVVGVFFSAVVAFGLAIVSRDRSITRDVQRFLYGDILTITPAEVNVLLGLFVAVMVFQALAFNRLLLIGLNPILARVQAVHSALYQYTFSALVALVVMFSVRAVGVLLVTALLIVPASAARNLARTAGGMFWWAALVSITSAVAGLLISAQDWAGTATGATIVLVSFGWFLVGTVVSAFRGTAVR